MNINNQISKENIGGVDQIDDRNINENGVSKNVNDTEETPIVIFEYLKNANETLDNQIETIENMIKIQKEVLGRLEDEKINIHNNYIYFNNIIEDFTKKGNDYVFEIDEKIKSVQEEIDEIEEFQKMENVNLLDDITQDIKMMVAKSEEKFVSIFYF